MTQYTSWNGRITKWYEDNLNLRGGYVRLIDRSRDPSIANSEYVKSDDVSLRVVARAGKKINPTPSRMTPHYKNPYGNDKSAQKFYEKFVKANYNKRIKMVQKMQRRK